MQDDTLTQQIAGVAALDEPVRRDLYGYVVEQGRPVGRDEAAAALGISRSLAAFHLDKLVEEDLLRTEYQRLTGRSGPGAGRPAKLYRRSDRQVEITLPPRTYELAARIFARTLDTLGDREAIAELGEVAHRFGADVAGHTLAASAPSTAREADAQVAAEALATAGYEPCIDEAGVIRLRNCPFHALAEDHRPLVCGMNLHLLQGLAEGLELTNMEAVLEPRPGMCCVALYPAPPAA